jgi:hypothetical protein
MHEIDVYSDMRDIADAQGHGRLLFTMGSLYGIIAMGLLSSMQVPRQLGALGSIPFSQHAPGLGNSSRH